MDKFSKSIYGMNFRDFLLFLFLMYFDGKVNSASGFNENSFENFKIGLQIFYNRIYLIILL